MRKRNPLAFSKEKWGFTIRLRRLVKVSKFQNEFMKSSYLPKYEPKIVRIVRQSTGILTIFGSDFWRNDDFINSF